MRPAGEYSSYVELISQTPTQDEIGGATSTYASSGSYFAAVEFNGAQLRTFEGSDRNILTLNVFLSGPIDVKSADRVRFDGEVYRIETHYYDDENDETALSVIHVPLDAADPIT